MGLKQHIVVVNEYTIKNADGKGGSRGGTPGDYVARYMAREDATEHSLDEGYIQDYMAREGASEPLTEDEFQPKRRKRQLGGVAFGKGNVSMTHDDVIKSSKSIQNAFDNGKTVMKTVLSFDEEYLRANGIVDDDFEFTQRGDYRGNIDQLKLRYAIMNGMEYFGRDYDDLQYVGVIQVDTAHVHCHLAMVDMGDGIIMDDGTQKGKLSANSMNKIRRGINMALDETKEVQFMASNVDLNKRRAQLNTKRYTYNQVTLYGTPQKLLSVLPEDETMWRASTNRKEMKTANKICRDYVESILRKPDSGMSDAMQSIYDYVDARIRREGIDNEEQQKLIRNGREKIVQDCMNSVYTTIRQIPKDRRYVETDFLSMSASPMVTPSFNGDSQDFVYKMSAYSKRLDKHRTQAKRFTEFVHDYEESQNENAANDASRALYNYFLIEQEYQTKLAAKYSQFLFFEPPSDDFAEEYIQLSKKARTLEAMKQLANDVSAKRMKPANAEEYGRERYDVYGGRYVVLDPAYFNKRIDKYQNSYDIDNHKFLQRLASENLKITQDDQGRPIITRKQTYDFDDIKGLDLHDLRGDFNNALEFSGYVRQTYMDMAERRLDAYDAACEYLDATGQSELKSIFDIEDIEQMRYVYSQLAKNQPVQPLPQPIMEYEDKKTIALDKRMHRAISRNVSTVLILEKAESMNLETENTNQNDNNKSILESKIKYQ